MGAGKSIGGLPQDGSMNHARMQAKLDELIDYLMSLPENQKKLADALTNYYLYGNTDGQPAKSTTPTCGNT